MSSGYLEKTLYLDCFSGISGDMFCSALIDLGFGIQRIRKEIENVIPGETAISSKRVTRCGISSTNFNVKRKTGARKYRTMDDIKKIYKKSRLPKETISRCIEIFTVIAEAEAKVHCRKVSEIHFHEIGAIDSIVDITAAVTGLEYLGIGSIVSSSVNLGGGIIKISHGIYPVPAPATAEILKGVPVYGSEGAGELTTPTGAALLKVLCGSYGCLPSGKITATGYGAGFKDSKERANVLRVVVIENGRRRPSLPDKDKTIVIETNIDDQDPQSFEYVMGKLFNNGALDVWFTAVMMKKSRPAVKISILCDREKLDILSGLLLSETTTFGVRYYETERFTLERKVCFVATKYGRVSVKVGIKGKDIIKISPEYESVKMLAQKTGIPMHSIIKEVNIASESSKFKKRCLVS